MEKLEDRSQIQLLGSLAIIVYFASYVTRINFGAIIVEFTSSENITKSSASVITTVAFITYGVGQLLSGWLGDLINPRLLIGCGYAVTIAMNILMPICSPNITLMQIIWGINGIAQAFMWPPLYKILANALPDVAFGKAISKIGIGSAGGTIAVYLFSPLIIRVLGWKYVFYVSALFATLVGTIWMILSSRILKDIEYQGHVKKEVTPVARTEDPVASCFIALLPLILITIVFQGMLRDGVTTWFPSFISENFNIGSSISILTTIALPIFHVLFSLITYRILHRIFRDNVFACIAVYFLIATLMLVGLFLFGTNNLILGVLLLSMSIGFIHGVNSLQTCFIPNYFRATGKTAFIVGVVNATTYIGSALSTYLFALFSEKIGWNMTIYNAPHCQDSFLAFLS